MRCDKYQKIQFRDNHHRDPSVRDLQAPSLNLKMSAASERYTAGHGPVGGGRILMPKVWLLHGHAGARHARQCQEKHRGFGRVGSEVRRALSFIDVQVPSWCDLDEAGHLQLLGYTSSVYPSGNGADGDRRKEEVSKGQTAHFMILNYSSKKNGN